MLGTYARYVDVALCLWLATRLTESHLELRKTCMASIVRKLEIAAYEYASTTLGAWLRKVRAIRWPADIVAGIE